MWTLCSPVTLFLTHMTNDIGTILTNVTLFIASETFCWSLYRTIDSQMFSTTTSIAKFCIFRAFSNKMATLSTIVTLLCLGLQIAFWCYVTPFSTVKTPLLCMGFWAIFGKMTWAATQVTTRISTSSIGHLLRVRWGRVHVILRRVRRRIVASTHHVAFFLYVTRFTAQVAPLQPRFVALP